MNSASLSPDSLSYKSLNVHFGFEILGNGAKKNKAGLHYYAVTTFFLFMLYLITPAP